MGLIGVWPESKSFMDNELGPIPSKWKGICQHNDGFTCNRYPLFLLSDNTNSKLIDEFDSAKLVILLHAEMSCESILNDYAFCSFHYFL